MAEPSALLPLVPLGGDPAVENIENKVHQRQSNWEQLEEEWSLSGHPDSCLRQGAPGTEGMEERDRVSRGRGLGSPGRDRQGWIQIQGRELGEAAERK